MLEVKDLHVNYGHIEAVRGVNLSVQRGKVTLVLGANGAGKTTTLKAVAGLLSGGEQQMLAFGRALMSQPKIMLLDEPSMGLAPVIVDTVLEKVRAMANAGIGILMVEQNAEAGLDVADDVVAIARGEVV